MEISEMQPEDAPQVRHIREDDAAAYVGLCKRWDAETRFMMFEPGERHTTVDEQRAIIAAIALYEGFGFELEGERRAALMIDGEAVDEFYMAKILRPDGKA